MTCNYVKRTSILFGAITFTALASGVSLAATQPSHGVSKTTNVTVAQKMTSGIVEQLQLTNDQKTKIRGIRAARTRKINGVLSSAQQTQLQKELKSGKKLGQVIKDLNLSADQKKKVLAIVQQSNKDIMATLKPDQQQKLEAYLKQQRQNRAQNPIE